MFLHNGETGDVAYLSGTAPVSVVPGTYDLYYSAAALVDAQQPTNGNALLQRGLKVDADTTLNIDLKPITLRGTITVAGMPEVSNEGQIYLVGDYGDKLLLGRSGAPSYSTVVLPGTYDIYYAWAPWGVSNWSKGVPGNRFARLGCITAAR